MGKAVVKIIDDTAYPFNRKFRKMEESHGTVNKCRRGAGGFFAEMSLVFLHTDGGAAGAALIAAV